MDTNRLYELHQLIHTLESKASVSEMLQYLSQAVTHLVQGHGGMVALRGPEAQAVLQPVGYNLPEDYARLPAHHQEPIWRTVLQGETLMLDDYSAHPEALPAAKKAGFRSLLAVPLLAGNSVIGGLAVFRTQVRPFSETDRLSLEMVGSLTGARIHSIRMNATLLQQSTEISLMHTLSAIAAEASSISELLQRTTDLLQHHFLAANCGILLLDPERKLLTPHGSYHKRSEIDTLPSIPLEKGISGRVARSGQSARIDDVTQCDDYLMLDPKVRSELCVPIRIGDEVIGVINLESHHRGAFSPTDQALLEAIASQLSSTLEKLRLLDEERHRRQLAESLQQATTTLISSLDLDHVLNNILGLLQQVLPMDSGSVLLIEDDQVRVAAVIGFDHPESILNTRHPLSSRLLIEVINRRAPLILEDASQDERFEGWRGTTPIRGWMSAPLIVHDEVIGFLTLDSQQPNAFHESDAALVQTLANQAALALYNARLFRETQQRTHELKVLYNSMLEISRSTDRDDLLQHLGNQLQQHFHPDAFLLVELDGKSPEVSYAALQGTPLEHWFGRPLPATALPPLEWVQQTRQMLIAHDTNQRPLLGMAQDVDAEVQSRVILPLTIGERLIAVMMLEYFDATTLDQHNLDFLQAFAAQAAMMLENMSLYQQALQSAEQWAILHWAGQEITQAGLDVERIYNAVYQAARRLMPCDAFAITLYHPERETIEGAFLVDRGHRATPFTSPARNTLTQQVVSSKTALRIDDLAAHPEAAKYVRFGTSARVRSVVATPLKVGERLMGMVSAQSYRPYAYKEQDTLHLEILATHAGVAIENARLFNTIERRAIHLLTAAEVARDAAILSEVDTLLQRVVNLVRDRFGFYHAGIFLVDEAREYAVLRAATGPVGRKMVAQGHRLKIGETGIVGYVTHTGQPRIADNVLLDQIHYKNPLLPETRSEMALPLRVGKEIIGALDVQSRQQDAFSDDDVAVLQTLADQIAVAIYNAQLYARERQRLEVLEALRKTSLRLTASLDLEHVGQTILEQGLSLTNAWEVHLFLYDQELTLVGVRRKGTPHPPFDVQVRPDGIPYTVARSGQALVIPEATQHPLSETTSWRGAIASLPLKIGQKVRGVFNVLYDTPHFFKEEELQILQLFIDQAAIALENARLYEELEQGYIDTILALGRAINARDSYISDHSTDLTELAVATAQEMGCDPETVDTIRWAALLHDIGKIGIPDRVLQKPGPLTPEERAVIEQHPDIGAEIVAPIRRLAHLAPIIRAHQEKYDGTGYPQGLKGEAIPLEARILAVADAYSAMIDQRVYKDELPPEAAVHEIQRSAGTHFDPQVVDAFLRVLRRRKIIQSKE